MGALLEGGTGFHPELSGRENIYLNGAMLGMSRVEVPRKFDEIVACVEGERFLDTLASTIPVACMCAWPSRLPRTGSGDTGGG